jgi:hypothetical protein
MKEPTIVALVIARHFVVDQQLQTVVVHLSILYVHNQHDAIR